MEKLRSFTRQTNPNLKSKTIEKEVKNGGVFDNKKLGNVLLIELPSHRNLISLILN